MVYRSQDDEDVSNDVTNAAEFNNRISIAVDEFREGKCLVEIKSIEGDDIGLCGPIL